MRISESPGCITIDLNLNKLPSNLEVITECHKQLLRYRDDGRVPSKELLEDIAAYEAVLNSSDPEAHARAYFEFKERVGMRLRPREIAQLLGWVKP